MSGETGIDLYIDYKGWRWRAPFLCMRCGAVVDVLQWAYSRSCGGCDVGSSQTARLPVTSYHIFAGPHELIDAEDPHFLEEDRFLTSESFARGLDEAYPVLNPPVVFSHFYPPLPREF